MVKMLVGDDSLAFGLVLLGCRALDFVFWTHLVTHIPPSLLRTLALHLIQSFSCRELSSVKSR